jgi:hypothetical protein
MTQLAPARNGVPMRALAGQEIRHYLRHPLFLLGLVLTVAVCASGPDPVSSSVFHVIVPGAGLGVFGLLVMVSLVRRSDLAHAAAGTTAVTEAQRTVALAAATVVPLTAGLAFFVWAVWAYHDQPPLPSAVPFGEVGDAWVYAVLLSLGTLPAVGGPVLGLVVGRWLHFRGAGLVSAVLLVLGTVVMQGLVEPLRFVRVFWPWTYFGGPYGTDGDAERWLILTGSPAWYAAYLVALCVLGVLVAVLHDREVDRTRLLPALGVVAGAAVVLGVLAMTQGVQSTMVNPLPSDSAPAGG